MYTKEDKTDIDAFHLLLTVTEAIGEEVRSLSNAVRFKEEWIQVNYESSKPKLKPIYSAYVLKLQRFW